MATYSGSTIFDVIVNNRVADGNHTFTLNFGTSQDIQNVAVKNFYGDSNGDFIYTGQLDVFNDITTADTFMCVRIFHGNLTINNNRTFDPPVRTRGFFVFVKGNLTNNGTISMTAKGASAAAPSADLQIWGTATIPRVGQTGAGTVTISSNTGNAAAKGAAPTGTKPSRGTGGGGSGGARRAGTTTAATIVGGGGSTGSIWAGGSGGGGAFGINGNATGGTSSSTTGGVGAINCVTSPGAGVTLIVGGGAGVVGGNGRTITGATGTGTAVTSGQGKGPNESGGLLMVACLGTLTNNNVIASNGSMGGVPNTSGPGGGGSGAGSINLLYKSISGSGITTVQGFETNATFTAGLDANGGAGGSGSSTLETFSAASITQPRRTLINAGGTLYYRNFELSTWVSAGSAGSTTPFEQFGMLDGEVLALDRAMIAGISEINLTSVTFQTFVPS